MKIAKLLQVAAGVAAGVAAAGMGIYEVVTKFNHHHSDHPRNGNK